MGILQNLREVVKNMKHDQPMAKLCPRCGKNSLRLSSRFDIWLFPEQYVCISCGYRGAVTLEIVDENETKETGDA